MSHSRPARHVILACCLGLLTASAAFAQGGGSGGSAGGAGAAGGTGGAPSAPGAQPGVSQPGTPLLGSGGASGTGQGGAGGGPGASQGAGGAGRGAQTESQLRESGAARPPVQDEQQLRDLNAISRQLTPGTPVPAPEADGARSGR